MDLFFKLLVEFIGTFVFLSVIITYGEGIPIGLTLAALIYWGGKISGGNFNPAVSIMMFLNKKMDIVTTSLYILVQIIAIFCALSYYKFAIKKIKK